MAAGGRIVGAASVVIRRTVLLTGVRVAEVQQLVAFTRAAGSVDVGAGGCGACGHDPSRLSVGWQPVAALPLPIAEAALLAVDAEPLLISDAASASDDSGHTGTTAKSMASIAKKVCVIFFLLPCSFTCDQAERIAVH